MGDMRNGGRRNGLWEMCSMAAEEMDCGRCGALWETQGIVGGLRYDGRSNGLWEIWDMASEGMDCGKGEE